MLVYHEMYVGLPDLVGIRVIFSNIVWLRLVLPLYNLILLILFLRFLLCAISRFTFEICDWASLMQKSKPEIGRHSNQI